MTLAPVKKSKLSAELSWQFKRIGGPEMSPDGSFVIATVTHCHLADNRMQTDLWYFPTDGGPARQLTTHAQSSMQPAIHPDGQSVAFLSQRDRDTGPQIYILPLHGGEARRVTNLPVGVSELAWFPDGKSLAFVASVLPGFTNWDDERSRLKERSENKSSARIWDKAPVTDWDRFVDEKETHLFRVDSSGLAVESLTVTCGLPLPKHTGGPLGGSRSFSLHPNGQSLALVSIGSQVPGEYRRDIFLVDLVQGTTKNLTADNPANDFAPLFSPDGSRLVWLSKAIVGFYGDTNRIMLADAEGNHPIRLHDSWDRSPQSLVWEADGSKLFAEVDDSAHFRIYEISLSEHPPKALTEAMSYSNLAASKRSGQKMVALQQGFTSPPTLVLLDASRGELEKLSQLNDELYESIDWGHYESVHYEGADGRMIQMWINYPPDFDRSQAWPLLLLNHGGPHNAIVDSMQWRWNAQVFAAMGYVVAWHNFHGSSGFGQDFADSINPDWVSKPYEDTIKAAAYFEQQSWIDEKCMISGGGSYGGYLTAILLGREHPFQALIAHAAVYNLYSQYGCDVHFMKERHGEFWENSQVFEQTSPHLRAAHFKTPTLIIHGQQDYRVPVTHAMELFHTLQKIGVASRLVYFPDENHWVLKPHNSLLWYREVELWLKRFAPPQTGR